MLNNDGTLQVANPQPETAISAASPRVFDLAGLAARRDELVRLAYRFCWNRSDAEDAVHNALLIASQRQDQLHDKARLWSWLRTIVVRQCHDLHRDNVSRSVRHEKAYDIVSDTTSTNATYRIENSDSTDNLRQLIERLPERQRTALILRHLEGLPYAEVAELMEVTESTARVHVRAAREALRARLEE